MAYSVSKLRQDYALFSMRVDQYFHAVNIFARHYDRFKKAYSHLPSNAILSTDKSNISEDLRLFVISASSTLNWMGTTHIFSDAPDPYLKNLPKDIINYSFYTCFCFQWTLFENFVQESIKKLMEEEIIKVESN